MLRKANKLRRLEGSLSSHRRTTIPSDTPKAHYILLTATYNLSQAEAREGCSAEAFKTVLPPKGREGFQLARNPNYSPQTRFPNYLVTFLLPICKSPEATRFAGRARTGALTVSSETCWLLTWPSGSGVYSLH